MKFFSQELRRRCQSEDEAVLAAAEQEWEAANERYEEHLRSFAAELPEHIREFRDLLLHDAIVHDIARQGDRLIMVLRKDIPPRDMVILTYTLVADPEIRRPEPAQGERMQVMDFQFDELDLLHAETGPTFLQEIVFGNGWEMAIRFKDVCLLLAKPIYPALDTLLVPVPNSV